MIRRVAAISIVAFLTAGTAHGLDLNIGISESPTSVDPHRHDLRVNNEVGRHVFEALTWLDKMGRPQPQLATGWAPLDDLTWSFKLRQNVTFHDGSAFEARDFIYTACRIAMISGEASPFALYTKTMASIAAPDPHTLVIKTTAPHPLLPVELAKVGILSARANGIHGDFTYPDGCASVAHWPDSQDFDFGDRAIGTGPFKLVDFIAGERVSLVRHGEYWSTNSEWERVTFKPILNPGARLAALLAGDVDFISAPATAKIPWLEMSGSFNVEGGISSRMIYLQFDHRDRYSPGVTGVGDRNPFTDPRVRAAVAHAIDREAIVELVGEVAAPAAGLAPRGTLGAGAKSVVNNFDPGKSRELLAAAGYPGGFDLALAVPNNLDTHSVQVAGAVARMLTEVGITSTVDAAPADDFFRRRGAGGLSLFLGAWDAGASDLSTPLRALLATPSPKHGLGVSNHGDYSNERLDALVRRAMTAIDPEERAALFTEANALAMADTAIVPLYHEVTTWSHRWGIVHDRRIDEPIVAMRIMGCSNFCHGNSTRNSEHANRLLILDGGAQGYGN